MVMKLGVELLIFMKNVCAECRAAVNGKSLEEKVCARAAAEVVVPHMHGTTYGVAELYSLSPACSRALPAFGYDISETKYLWPFLL